MVAALVQVAIRCHCPKPRFYEVYVARPALAAMLSGSVDLDEIVFAFRCRHGCGINHVPWSVVIRASHKK